MAIETCCRHWNAFMSDVFVPVRPIENSMAEFFIEEHNGVVHEGCQAVMLRVEGVGCMGTELLDIDQIGREYVRRFGQACRDAGISSASAS
eukprot:2304282-Amphidinium_carterae.1